MLQLSQSSTWGVTVSPILDYEARRPSTKIANLCNLDVVKVSLLDALTARFEEGVVLFRRNLMVSS